ncbi:MULTISPECIES: DoxX family protein [unclassified Roseovarius]|uniref:DoxX family protein n=1 Tax=unclassified Roseovarius TaxID=2614913 RepID=UPI00273D33D2|nr:MULTISPECIES: DoxX family protein [unclassified Roseovarius]
MSTLIYLHNAVFHGLEKADWLLPTIARFLFAALFVLYFWVSGLTKLGDGFTGLFVPSFNAYAQIFPRAMEAANYDISNFTIFHTLVVLAGTYAEFILPLLIVIGLMTRLAALGMIGFVAVQTLTDLYGHNIINQPKALGAWFDKVPDSIIMDQRALWVFLLLVIVFKGAGPISVDRVIANNTAPKSEL